MAGSIVPCSEAAGVPGPSALCSGRQRRYPSPLRAASPSRARSGSPLRAGRRKDTPLFPSLSSSSAEGSSLSFLSNVCSPLVKSESAAPSLQRRPLGLFGRQPLGGKLLHRGPVRTSLKFPGETEEETQKERPVAVLEQPQAPAILDRDEEEGFPPSDGVIRRADEPKSSLDRIELQANESLAKLKHLLYKLKTRNEGVVAGSLVTSTYSAKSPREGASSTLVEDEQQIFVSQKIEVDLSKPAEDFKAADASANGILQETEVDAEASTSAPAALPARQPALDLAALQKGLEVQLDALTATRATVKFDDATQTATVTVTATVRAAEIEDKGGFSEKAIAMAARALARTCLEFDEKVQAAALSSASPLPRLNPSPARSLHQRVQRDLLSGSVESWELATPEFGCTPFRPVYLVKLRLLDGSAMEAIYKPCLPGDKMLRWRRAPEDWVAYQLALLLGMDVVPPAVVRSNVAVGGRHFDLGVMVIKPSMLLRLENANPNDTVLVGPSRPEALVSDIRILDTLMGSALRPKEAFLATKGHWAELPTGGSAESIFPVALAQPMGPHLGAAIHSMWTGHKRSGPSWAVQVVSAPTLSKLKNLTQSALLEVFGGVLSQDEIEAFLVKRDHLLAYFDGLSRREGWASVCV